jgi:hypothetical protein
MGEKGGALNQLAELEIPPSRTQFSHKNLSTYYIRRPPVLPPVGWGALDGRDVGQSQTHRPSQQP